MIMASKGRTILAFLILLIIIIVLPVVILGAVYQMNEDFRLQANEIMRDAPIVGEYFKKQPTPNEKLTRIKEISEYMLDIDKLRAVDKLEKIKLQDEKIYDQVIKFMIRDNPNRTQEILKVIRDNELSEDLITTTIGEIESERDEELKKEATNLMNLSDPLAKEEMEKIIDSSLNGHLKLAQILKNLETTNVAKLLDLLNDQDFSGVLELFSYSEQEKIRKILSTKRIKFNNLSSIIEIYKVKTPEELATILTPSGEYDMESLVYIYKALGPKLTGQVLAAQNNDQFNIDLVNEIKEDQILETGKDDLSKDILKSLKIFETFDDNISELTSIYKTMESQKVANALEKMLRNASNVEIYELDNGEKITITDETIAIEIINSFNQNRKAEILSFMSDAMASEVSRKLTLPRNY